MPPQICRRCPNQAEKGPYCTSCADRMITAALTSPTAALPPDRSPRRRRYRPASAPRQAPQPSLFDQVQ